MTGKCLCGAVAFEFEGPLSSIELCHCSRCQRSTGAPFAAEFRVSAERFRWLSGEAEIGCFDAPILREPPAYRCAFCCRCGSPLPAVFPGQPNVAIPTGLVDGELPARARRHIWVDHKANWLELGELAQLPQEPGDPPV